MTQTTPTLRAAIGRRVDRPSMHPSAALDRGVAQRRPTYATQAQSQLPGNTRRVVRWLFLGALILFPLVDTSYGEHLPGGSRSRLIVPVLFLGMLATVRSHARREQSLVYWLIFFALAGAA